MAFEELLMVYNCSSKISLLSFFTELQKVDQKEITLFVMLSDSYFLLVRELAAFYQFNIENNLK